MSPIFLLVEEDSLCGTNWKWHVECQEALWGSAFLQMQRDKPARCCSFVSEAWNKQVSLRRVINLFPAIVFLLLLSCIHGWNGTSTYTFWILPLLPPHYQSSFLCQPIKDVHFLCVYVLICADICILFGFSHGEEAFSITDMEMARDVCG